MPARPSHGRMRRLREVTGERIRRLRTIRRARARRPRAAKGGEPRGSPRCRDRARGGAQPGRQRRGDAALRLRAKGHCGRSAGRSVSRRAVSSERFGRLARGRQGDARLALLRRRAGSRGGQRARAPAQARRPRDLRPDEFVRARPLPHLRACALRPDEEPVGHDAHLRGLERRRGRFRRRAHPPHGARFRRVRLDPRAGVVLRDRRPEADAIAQHDGAVRRRRARWSEHRARRDPVGARFGGAARCDVRRRPRRSLRRSRTRTAVSCGSGSDPGKLRVGFTSVAPNGAPVEADSLRALAEVAKLCADLGHRVEEVAPEIDGAAVVPAFLTLVSANTVVNLASHLTKGRPPLPGEVENVTYATGQLGEKVTAADYIRATQSAHRLGRQMAAFHATYDVLLTPALATLPPKLGWIDMMMDDVHEYWRRVFHFSPFTVCFNLTGQPAIVLPLAQCDATPTTGFPISVQFIARHGDEAMLFRLAAQLEKARPWFDRKSLVAL